MRNHPIIPVTEPLQYRAIGLVRATYIPEDTDRFTKGNLVDEEGVEIEAVVLGRVITLMRRHLDMTKAHLWVVYPRSRKDDEHLHLQIAGVWEPSTLEINKKASDNDLLVNSDNPIQDKLPEGDDYFSIRGELIFTKPETGDLVVKIRQRPKNDGSRPIPFKLPLKGEIPFEKLRHFISFDVRRRGQKLHLEDYQVVAPVPGKDHKGKSRNPKDIRKGVNKNV